MGIFIRGGYTFKTKTIIPNYITVTLGEPNADATVEIDRLDQKLEPIKYGFKLKSARCKRMYYFAAPNRRSIYELGPQRYAIRQDSNDSIFQHRGIATPLQDFVSGRCCWLEIIGSAGLLYGYKVTNGNATVLGLYDEWPTEIVFIVAELGDEILLFTTKDQDEERCLKLVFDKNLNGNFKIDARFLEPCMA